MYYQTERGDNIQGAKIDKKTRQNTITSYIFRTYIFHAFMNKCRIIFHMKYDENRHQLDLQGQICHESLNVCVHVIPCGCDYF